MGLACDLIKCVYDELDGLLAFHLHVTIYSDYKYFVKKVMKNMFAMWLCKTVFLRLKNLFYFVPIVVLNKAKSCFFTSTNHGW